MLKRLDATFGGLRFGTAQSMTGNKIAPIFRAGPLAVGRIVIGDIKPGTDFTLRDDSSMFENTENGVGVRLDPNGNNLRVFRWYADSLGHKIVRILDQSPQIG